MQCKKKNNNKKKTKLRSTSQQKLCHMEYKKSNQLQLYLFLVSKKGQTVFEVSVQRVIYQIQMHAFF